MTKAISVRMAGWWGEISKFVTFDLTIPGLKGLLISFGRFLYFLDEDEWFLKILYAIIKIMKTFLFFYLWLFLEPNNREYTCIILHIRAYFNYLVPALPARSAFFVKRNDFFSNKNSKNTYCLRGFKKHNGTLLLDFLVIFWLYLTHTLIF